MNSLRQVLVGFSGCILVAVTVGLAPAMAQQSGVSSGRDCQVVRTCNFARGAAVRGCLSSYTCRTCRFVRARCTVGSRSGRCDELICTWGG